MATAANGGSWRDAAGQPGGGPAYALIVAFGAVLWWLSAAHPAVMPFWAPWEFSPTFYLAATLALLWYGRGLALTPVEERPAAWRRVAYVLGVGLVYAVLQTRYEYWALHMFFLNRIQHVAMHHIGPFLIALGAAGGAVRNGMPARLRRWTETRPTRAVMRLVQQPLIGAFLFVGLVVLWLIPPVHLRAMLDARLYAVMNWSMVADGVLFWWLVLDPRPCPPARVSYGARAALSFGVMFPQIALGATIAFARSDLYPYYDLCGRLLPSIDAIADQHIGGIVIWIPPAMMSVLGMLVVIGALRRHEDATTETTRDGAALAELAKTWTGR
jgi:putative membrane protein